MGRAKNSPKRTKFEPIGSDEPRKKNTPLDVQIRRFCQKNTWLMVLLAAMLVVWVLMYVFGRSRAASIFAASQGFEFSSSADYKLPKKLGVFETLSRGSKQYGFNAMKGELAYGEDASKVAAVTAFDYSYTETRLSGSKKRVSKSDKVHELSAMMFGVEKLGIKSLLISPRDMVIEGQAASPATRADPDVEDVMSSDKNEDEKNEDEDEDDDDDEKPAVAVDQNSTAADDDEPASEQAEEPAEEELDQLSARFNETFVVETVDANQTAAVISPALKKLLLSQPTFMIDFQDHKFLVYREYTFEPADYDTALQLGKAVAEELNREIPGPTEGNDLSAAPLVYVSRSKEADTP
jgi:hypothetical protein